MKILTHIFLKEKKKKKIGKVYLKITVCKFVDAYFKKN